MTFSTLPMESGGVVGCACAYCPGVGGPARRSTKAGAGPRHLTFNPNGKFAYLITETTATIGTYAV